MAGVSFLICLCVSLMKQAMLKLMGGAILDSAGSAAQSLSCKSCEKFSLLNNNGLSKLSLLWFYEYIFISRNGYVKNRLPFNTILQTLY